MIDPRPAITLTDRISASPALLDTLAPAVGLLLRERTAVMLRTNLSTRPFYNERAVPLALAVVAVLVLAATVFNVTRLVALSQRQRPIGGAADERGRERTCAAAAGERGARPAWTRRGSRRSRPLRTRRMC